MQTDTSDKLDNIFAKLSDGRVYQHE